MTSNHENIFDFKCVTSVQKALLRQCQHKLPFTYVAHLELTLFILTGRINRLSELILTPASELSRRSKRPLAEIDYLVDNICREYSSTSLKLDRLTEVIDNKFTTGDASLDRILGGGIRTGMVWEISGER